MKKMYVFFTALFLSGLVFSQNAPEAEALEKRGDAHGRSQQWEQAATCYKRLVTHYPEVADYHYKYGGVLGMLALENKMKALGLVGDIKKAFKKAAHLDPGHKAVRRALVELYMQLPGILGGSRKQALHYADELERLSKAEGYLAKGYIYEYEEEDEKAAKYYAMALRHLHTLNDPSINRLRYTVGKLCGDHHTKLDKGIHYLKDYLRHYTAYDAVKKPVAYCEIAKLYRLKNDKEKALFWIGKALAADASFKAAQREKALIEAL